MARLRKYMVEYVNAKAVKRMERFEVKLVKYIRRLIGYEMNRMRNQAEKHRKMREARDRRKLEGWNEDGV